MCTSSHLVGDECPPCYLLSRGYSSAHFLGQRFPAEYALEAAKPALAALPRVSSPFQWLERARYGGGQYFTSLVVQQTCQYLHANNSIVRVAWFAVRATARVRR
jgi:hypothetical protein